MKEPDREEFIKAMEKEINSQVKGEIYSLIHNSEVPKRDEILPAVWQMHRKREILTRRIKKYKACLNIDGSCMKKGIHYDQTYAPVVKWNSICMLLSMVAVHGWHKQQIIMLQPIPNPL